MSSFIISLTGFISTIVFFSYVVYTLNFLYCKGKIECVLYKKYVGLFKDMLRGFGSGLPVVVIKFGKICKEEGDKHGCFVAWICSCFACLTYTSMVFAFCIFVTRLWCC